MTLRNRVLAMAAILAVITVARADAAVLWVENFGVDSPTCGSSLSSPCRSISQAIGNASTLDVVLVGPGIYGDIDYDGAFTTPGDEAGSVGVGCNCVLNVSKRLTILGRRGPGATVIFYGVSDGANIVSVANSAAGTIFRGFTITGNRSTDDGIGLMVLGDNAVILGNRVLAAGDRGIFVFGDGVKLVANQVLGSYLGFEADGAGNILSANTAMANPYAGFVTNGAPGVLLAANQAVGNGVGLWTQGSGSNRLVANLAAANTWGFEVSDDNNLLAGNVASANYNGYSFGSGTGNLLIASSAQGNGWGAGVLLDSGSGLTVTRCSIFGNGETGGNCGLQNDTSGPVTASYNFWGAASGPGPNPADAVCDTGGGTTTYSPVMTVPPVR
jgi:Right handed beta helix region